MLVLAILLARLDSQHLEKLHNIYALVGEVGLPLVTAAVFQWRPGGLWKIHEDLAQIPVQN